MSDLDGTMEVTALYNFFSDNYELYVNKMIDFIDEEIIKKSWMNFFD